MKQQTKTATVKASVCALCVAAAAICAVFLATDRVIYYVSVSVLALTATVFAAIDGEIYPHASRIAFVMATVSVALAVCYVLYVSTGLSERFSDFESLKKFILESGFWGVAVFIALTVFQVVVLPIPQAVTILLGVAIYGATVSFILSTVGTYIGSMISFVLGKVFGRRLCNWMFGEEATAKYAKLLGERGKFLFTVMLLFPAFPDDMLCMVAGITSMSYAQFSVICALTRPVMIGITAYLGSGVIPFDGWGIPVWVGIACLAFVAFLIVNAVKKRIR